MTRITERFNKLKAEGRKAFIPYITAGDPDLATTERLILALAEAGADVIELGVPFSDPLADGPVIQRAVERALAAGGSMRATLDMIASIRSEVTAPIVLFTYANPIVRMGLDAFATRAAEAGVDGVLALDLPVEEADEFREALTRHGLDTIFLLSPTTIASRIKRAGELGSGFLYGISRLGVTGARETVATGAEDMVRRIRAVTNLPLALGFGISTPAHVAEVGAYADAAVVGSALVALIAQTTGAADQIARVEDYVRSLRAACVASKAS